MASDEKIPFETFVASRVDEDGIFEGLISYNFDPEVKFYIAKEGDVYTLRWDDKKFSDYNLSALERTLYDLVVEAGFAD